MLALGKEKLLQMLDEEPALAEYRFYIENMVRLSDHVLSADKEAVFAQSHLATGTAAAAFRALVSADMQFPEITDGQGNKANVSEGCYLLNMTSPDRVLRKNSFTGLMNTYHQYRNTLAATLTGSARTGYFFATVHNYKDTLEAALAEDNIPSSLYDGLIDTVHDNFAPLHEYIQLKKDVLGVDEFHYYDMYMPISTAGDSFACSFPEACAKVEEALAPLGEEYLTALHKGMTEGWIDVYENKGKRGGAYSWGSYGVHPFVLLNHNDTINSMFTLAHEMGHALHSFFTWKKQPFLYADHKIFVAEVASNCNEALLMEHLLKTTEDKTMRKYLINYFLEQFRGTLFRQTMFAEFEKITHAMAEKGEPLTWEGMNQIYRDLNIKYFGEDIVIDSEIDIEWARIPHFYNAFYVYQYATGYSAAIALSRKILNEGQPAVAAYLDFLSKGDSEYSIDLLKGAGVDMTTAAPIENAMQLFKELLDEFETL